MKKAPEPLRHISTPDGPGDPGNPGGCRRPAPAFPRPPGGRKPIADFADCADWGASESADRLDSRTGHPLATTDRRIRGGAALYSGVGSARLTTDSGPCIPPDPLDDLVHTDRVSMMTPRTFFPDASIHKSRASLLVKTNTPRQGIAQRKRSAAPDSRQARVPLWAVPQWPLQCMERPKWFASRLVLSGHEPGHRDGDLRLALAPL